LIASGASVAHPVSSNHLDRCPQLVFAHTGMKGFFIGQTSSDTEVVEIIFMRLFAARSKGSSKAFCPLYYHSIVGI